MRFYRNIINDNENTEHKNTENNNTELKNTENKNNERINCYTCLGAQWNTGINALLHVSARTISTWGGGVVYLLEAKGESVEIFYERECCAGCH